jgi:nitroreductase
VDLDELLDRRRTVRTFGSGGIGDDELVDLLWAAQGRTSDGRRTTPSAMGRYPLRLLVARGPDPAGTWWWDPDGGTLSPGLRHDVRPLLAAAAIGDQPWVGTAPVTVAICADLDAMEEHFADQSPGRGRRYVDVEVGAAVQNLALAATVRGLAGVIVGGFDDRQVAEVLEAGPLAPRLLYSLGPRG